MPHMKKTVAERRSRKEAKRRRKRKKTMRGLATKYGQEVAELYAQVMHVVPDHSKARIFQLKQQVIGNHLGFKPDRCMVERVELLNWIAGKLFASVGWACMACGLQHKHPCFWDIDHIIPSGEGGSDGVENLQLLCPNCHKKKSQGIDGYHKRQSFKSGVRTPEVEALCGLPKHTALDEKVSNNTIAGTAGSGDILRSEPSLQAP